MVLVTRSKGLYSRAVGKNSIKHQYLKNLECAFETWSGPSNVYLVRALSVPLVDIMLWKGDESKDTEIPQQGVAAKVSV